MRRANRLSARRKSATAAPALVQRDWQLPVYRDDPIEPVSHEGVEAVHNAAMRVLEEIGIEFLHEDALAVLKREGCKVEGENVKMGRDFVMEKLKSAPETFTITPANPDRALTIGGRHFVYGNVSSPPNATDIDRGRRMGNREDFQNFLKLTHYFNCIHFAGGYPVEPVDLHFSTRHLDALYDKLTLTDKVIHTYSLGTVLVEDAIEMVRISCGVSDEEFDEKPRFYTNINSSSPLKHDWPMLDGAMRLAGRNQPVIVTPFTLAGAMAPITMAGAVTQQTAEALAAIALLQCVRPGAPVVMGAYTSNVDMKTGAPAFGTPEAVRAMQLSGQMARFYKLPLRAQNSCAGNFPDGQAIAETMNSLWAAMTSGTNVVYHGAGWLEGGLAASYEKFVIDCELIQQMMAYNDGIGVTDEDLAVDAIAEVGPTGHFFGAEHTQSRYSTEFYQPFLSDIRNFETWDEAGAPKQYEHANRLWKQILGEFEPPKMDEGARAELVEFVERRKREGGAPTNF